MHAGRTRRGDFRKKKNISWPAKKVILVMQRLHIGSDLINYVTRLLIYHFISDKCLKVGMQPIELKKKKLTLK